MKTCPIRRSSAYGPGPGEGNIPFKLMTSRILAADDLRYRFGVGEGYVEVSWWKRRWVRK